MIRKLFVVALLLLFVFAQDQPMMGGWSKMSPNDFAEFIKEPEYKDIVKKVKEAFEEKHNGQVQRILQVSSQIVAGVNYRLKVQTSVGQYVITVFSQVWTNTIDITGMKPAQESNEQI